MRSLSRLFLIMSLLVAWTAAWGEPFPSFEQVQQQTQSSDQIILDRSGQLLQRQRTQWLWQRGDWLRLDQISPALLRLLLHAEDQRFYEHAGVDWYAVLGSAWSSLWGQRLRGTSTLSMQLVDLLGLGSGRRNGPRSLTAKWEQARLAQQLEKRWTKAQILEAYVNLAPFKGELVGVDAMARVLWQKEARALNYAESALAVAMLPSPNASLSVLKARSCVLWRGVQPQADCEAYAWSYQQALARSGQPAWGNPQLAPHWGRWVGALVKTPIVKSSIDKTTQQQVQALIHKHLLDLRHSHVRDAAVVVLENISGHVVAYVGASAVSTASQYDHVQALRQAGSTLKPFLYALAFAQKRITPASLLADTAAQFSTPYGLYIPQNYDEQFMGWISARVALASSLNIPAVRVLAQVEVASFQRLLQQMGFSLPYAEDYYGLGLALGGVEVSLWQLSQAYRALANNGQWTPACLQADGCAHQAKPLLPATATWLVQHILSDNMARALTFGLDSPLHTPFWSAVKTGTSKDMRDNWAVGFSQHYTVGVWVGNTDGSAMHDVSGVSGAAPIWHEVMQWLHRDVSSEPPAMPAGVICQTIQYRHHDEPSRQECFLQGTQQAVIESVMTATPPRISAPTARAHYAWDPDIPVTQQQIRFEAKGVEALPIVWRINKHVVSRAAIFYWQPNQFGRLQIDLLHADTLQILDTIFISIQE